LHWPAASTPTCCSSGAAIICARCAQRRGVVIGVLVPVQVAPDMDSGSQLLLPASPATAVPASRSMRNAGVIELDIAGVQLRLRGPVDEASLCSVLRALRNSP
jgi:hypothetical protein